MFPELSCCRPCSSTSPPHEGRDSFLVRDYGIARTACPADARPDDLVTIEMWVPGADLWAIVGGRTVWSGEAEGEDEWEAAAGP